MKSQINQRTAFLFLLMAVLFSCSKEPLKRIPPPDKPAPIYSGNVSFVADANLSGQPYHSSNLTALVTVMNQTDSVVINEKMLTLQLDGSVRTESLRLPVGTYKLTGFRLVYGSVNTHFAAPIAGSAKAAAVQQPLPLSFTVSAKGSTIPVQVLKVAATEGPQHFGYPSGSFDQHQEENNPYMKVKIKASMQIGNVLYDSLPAALTLTTWNSQGEMSTTYHSLKSGINDVQVLKAASKFHFHISKWGITDEMTLERQNVDTITVYSLGGSKEAKKLKSELTYALIDGKYVPESKTDYVYNAEGRLFRIYHYLRTAENRPYLAMAENFHYNGIQLERIERFNEKNSLLGSTTFAFDQEGKVRSMAHLESGQQTTATVNYLYNPFPKATIHYVYAGQTYTMDHEMSLSQGNIAGSNTHVAGELSETGSYEYDSQINPYVHMNWPDIYLSRYSKNNLVKQYRYYYTHMPLAEPYDFSYTYDADGYPKELIKKFRSLPNRQHTKTTKTVFEY